MGFKAAGKLPTVASASTGRGRGRGWARVSKGRGRQGKGDARALRHGARVQGLI